MIKNQNFAEKDLVFKKGNRLAESQNLSDNDPGQISSYTQGVQLPNIS